jgi:hypothetical protein
MKCAEAGRIRVRGAPIRFRGAASCAGGYLAHLGFRWSVHLCRLNASSIALVGTFGISSRRCTNGCDHAQSEHRQLADAFVGNRIVRAVSVIPAIFTTLRSFVHLVLRDGVPTAPANPWYDLIQKVRCQVEQGGKDPAVARNEIARRARLDTMLSQFLRPAMVRVSKTPQ